MKTEEIITLLRQHFAHADKEYLNSRMNEDDDNSAYWQGRKDGLRVVQSEILVHTGELDKDAHVMDHARGFTSPDWEKKYE